MKKYISGPISGMPFETARNNFEAAAAVVKSSGHEPINPIEISKAPDAGWSDHMFIDLMALIHQSESIYMMRGWKQSQGACIEYLVNSALVREAEFEVYGEKFWPRFIPSTRGVLTRARFKVFNQEHERYWVDLQEESKLVYKRRLTKSNGVQTAIVRSIEHFGFIDMISILRNLDPEVHIPKPQIVPTPKTKP